MTRGDKYQGMLKIGQKIHTAPSTSSPSTSSGPTSLQDDKTGIIYEIQGEQRPETVRTLVDGVVSTGGNALFGVVFDDHKSIVPECIIRGKRWYISDEVATDEEIKDALTLQEILAATERREQEEAKVVREALRQVLPARYPYLIPVDKAGDISSHALCAKNIKKHLTVVYPNTKFSVKSERFSGGDSVTISWVDGPTRKDVEEIASLYSEGSYDPMKDLYEYHGRVWPEVFGGVKYIETTRSYSDNTISEAIQEVWKNHSFEGKMPTVNDYREGRLWQWEKGDLKLNRLVNKYLEKTAFIRTA